MQPVVDVLAEFPQHSVGGLVCEGVPAIRRRAVGGGGDDGEELVGDGLAGGDGVWRGEDEGGAGAVQRGGRGERDLAEQIGAEPEVAGLASGGDEALDGADGDGEESAHGRNLLRGTFQRRATYSAKASRADS